MKCAACGYKSQHLEEINGNTILVSDGIEDFDRLEGSFTIKTGFYRNLINEVNLYACPKCGTVRMEKW